MDRIAMWVASLTLQPTRACSAFLWGLLQKQECVAYVNATVQLPCAGGRLIVASVILAMVVAVIRRYGVTRTLMIIALSVGMAFAMNVIRIVLVLECRQWWPSVAESFHDVVGYPIAFASYYLSDRCSEKLWIRIRSFLRR